MVAFQSDDVKDDRDQAGQYHEDLPHDITLPVSSVVDHQENNDSVHEENSGREYIVKGPAAVSGCKVDADRGQVCDQGQDDHFALISGFSKDRMVEYYINVQQS